MHLNNTDNTWTTAECTRYSNGAAPVRMQSWWPGWTEGAITGNNGSTGAKIYQLKANQDYVFVVGEANDSKAAYWPPMRWDFKSA